MAAAMTDNSLEIRQFGCIESMRLPDGWFAVPEGSPRIAPFEMMRFFSPEHPDAQMIVTYNTRERDGSAIQHILSKPPHVLLPSEVASLAAVLNSATSPDNFRPLKLASEIWNDRMCLVINGRWIQEGQDVLWLVTNNLADFSSLMQVEFKTPKATSALTHAAALASLRSIKWRTYSPQG